MNKTLLFSIALTVISNYSFSQKILEGKAANDKVAGAVLVRIVENRSAPDFIKLSTAAQFNSTDAVSWMKAHLGLQENESLETKRTENDELGYEHIVYQHYYNGVPVENSQYRIHVLNQKVVSLNGEIYTGIQLNTSPNISIETAISNAKLFIGADAYRWENEATENQLKLTSNDPNATYYPHPELVIAPVNGNYNSPDFRLCYKMDIYASAPLSRSWVYVDAISGEVIWKTDRIHDTDTPATAHTMYSGMQTIITDSFSGGYRLKEAARGNGIQTFNLNNDTDPANGVDFVNSGTNWAATTPVYDQYALDAHFGAEKTYDYYMNIHSRNSLDNNGFALISYVHLDNNYGNAYWDGAEMNYGDGDGSTFNHPLTTLDIAGHEITHGLTEHTANLVYQDESGALNESFSDIFGVTIDNYGSGVTGPNLWRIGEQCTASGTGIRLMSNPGIFGDPDTYQGTGWVSGATDNGGVHTNSGVQNFWYYLMCSGGTGSNDNGDSYNVSGIPMADAANIAYRNLTIYLGSNATYDDSRFYSILAATDLFGACSPEVITTTNAWHAVGVGDVFNPTTTANFSAPATSICTAPATVNFNNLSNNGGTFHWYFGDGATSSSENPAHTYLTNGNYTVSLAIDGGACGTDSIGMNNYISINLPDAPTSSDQNSCGTTVATLTANVSGNAYWYTTPTGGTAVGTGTTFTTPPLSSTTTYYVEDRISNGGGNVGPATNTIGTGGNHNNTSTQYMEFTVYQALTIQTVQVYSAAPGNRNIQVWDNNGNLLQTIPINIGNGSQVITLNLSLQPGSYRIGGTQMNLYRNNAGAVFPYSLPGMLDITGSSAGGAYYYYFYNWSVSSSCISSRTPVTVNIDPVVANATYTTSGLSVTFNNTSTNGVSYEWNFGDGSTSTEEDPAHMYSAYGTYTVTLVTDNGNCTDTVQFVVVVSNAGIEEQNAASFAVYPNPFNNYVNIRLEGLETGNDLQIVAVNSLGQKVADVYNGKVQTGSQDISWSAGSSLSKGVYLLKISYDGKTVIRRIVKN